MPPRARAVSDIVLRPFLKADLPLALDLWEAAWRAGLAEPDRILDRGRFEQHFYGVLLPERVVLAAEIDGALAGFIVFDLGARFIDHLVVAPAHMRHGVGTTLARAALEILGHRAELRALQANPGAAAFWERLGFVRARETTSPSTGLPAWIYAFGAAA